MRSDPRSTCRRTRVRPHLGTSSPTRSLRRPAGTRRGSPSTTSGRREACSTSPARAGRRSGYGTPRTAQTPVPGAPRPCQVEPRSGSACDPCWHPTRPPDSRELAAAPSSRRECVDHGLERVQLRAWIAVSDIRRPSRSTKADFALQALESGPSAHIADGSRVYGSGGGPALNVYRVGHCRQMPATLATWCVDDVDQIVGELSAAGVGALRPVRPQHQRDHSSKTGGGHLAELPGPGRQHLCPRSRRLTTENFARQRATARPGLGAGHRIARCPDLSTQLPTSTGARSAGSAAPCGRWSAAVKTHRAAWPTRGGCAVWRCRRCTR